MSEELEQREDARAARLLVPELARLGQPSQPVMTREHAASG